MNDVAWFCTSWISCFPHGENQRSLCRAGLLILLWLQLSYGVHGSHFLSPSAKSVSFLPSPTMVKHTADWLKRNKRRRSPKLVQGKSSDAGLWVNSRGPNSSGQEDWPSDSRPSGDISFTFSAKMMASRLGTAARLFIQCDSLSSTPLPNLLLTTFPNSARSRELKKNSRQRIRTGWTGIVKIIPSYRCLSVSREKTWNFKMVITLETQSAHCSL